jgi:hypothetical protein
MAKNYGGSGTNTLEDLIAYYQQLQPDLNADDVRAGYEKWSRPTGYNNPFGRDSVDFVNSSPRRSVAENVSRDYNQDYVNIQTGTPEDDEYQKRLKAMRWMMMSESLDENGWIPQEDPMTRNSFPFGMLNNLINPKDAGTARREALTKLARDK